MLPADKTTNDRAGALARLSERAAKLEATAAANAQLPVIEKPRAAKQPSLLHDQIVKSDAIAAENELDRIFGEMGWDEDADLEVVEPVEEKIQHNFDSLVQEKSTIILPTEKNLNQSTSLLDAEELLQRYKPLAVKNEKFFPKQNHRNYTAQETATMPLIIGKDLNKSVSLLEPEDSLKKYELLNARSKELFYTPSYTAAESKRRYPKQEIFARERHNGTEENNIPIESAVFILFLAFIAVIAWILNNESKNSYISTSKVIDEVTKTYECIKNRNT